MKIGAVNVWRGWITSGVIIVPIVAAMIRQALFYKGCMDGFGWVLAAYAAFWIGGLLNLLSLSYFLLWECWHLRTRADMPAAVFLSGQGLSILVLVSQLVCGFIHHPFGRVPVL